MFETSTITIKGQVTLPANLRREFNLEPGEKVAFVQEAEGIKVKPLVDFFKLKGSIHSKKTFDIKKMRQAAAKSLGKKRHGKTS